MSRNNQLRNTFIESCRQAGVGGQMEVGRGLGRDERRTRPADVLVPNWDLELGEGGPTHVLKTGYLFSYPSFLLQVQSSG